MIRLKLTAIFLLMISFSTSVAQRTEPQEEEEEQIYFEKPKSMFKSNLRYGGNIWLGFFGAFYIDASPMVGYEITEAGTVVGVGGSFIYQGGYNSGGNLMAGPRFFIRQPIWRSIFAHAEYELMNAPENRFYSYINPNLPPASLTRKWEGSPLIGAGFYQGRMREQRGSFISIMYNVGSTYGKGFISPQGLGGNNSPWVLRFGFFL
jgi:hypothetical protein